MANEKNNTNFSKFGRGSPNNGSHENKLGQNTIVPRALIYQGGPLQQSFRFVLEIRGIDVAFITNVSRPSYSITTEESKLLNWSFAYPTGIKWDAVSFSVKEVFEGYNLQTILGYFYKKLTDYAWNTPNFDANSVAVGQSVGLGKSKDLSKLSLQESLGQVKIKSLNADGEVVEEWELHGAYISSVKPSQLSYDQDSLTTIEVSLTYDFATLSVQNGSATY